MSTEQLAIIVGAGELLVLVLDALTRHYQASAGMRRFALAALRVLSLPRYLKLPWLDAYQSPRHDATVERLRVNLSKLAGISVVCLALTGCAPVSAQSAGQWGAAGADVAASLLGPVCASLKSAEARLACYAGQGCLRGAGASVAAPAPAPASRPAP